ncbi:MAG: FAD-dependent oxidoreductase, partial [Clostridiales bacterium]|nr:FAD-dependent oxidoreductase [Clostridiales bacterium]
MYAIIIGAGPAGLTAAYYLLKKTDIIPIVLEESPYIGGISRTHTCRGNRMDLGGHRFFSKNDEVMALWRELMPLQGAPALDDILLNREKPLAEDGPDPECEDVVMLLRDRVSRIYYLRKFFDYPIALKWQTLRNLGFARTMKSGFGYVWARVFKRKEVTLKDFMVNRFGLPLYRMFFESYNEKLWGKNPEEIAPDWGAQRIKGLSLSKAVFSKVKSIFGKTKQVETSLIEQFLYPKKGPGQLWERMADEIVRMGGTVHLNQSVTRLRCEDGRVTSVQTEDGSVYEGDCFFSSMPVKDLIEAMETDVPVAVREVAQALPYRDFITVGLLAKKMQLKNETNTRTVGDIVPDCWIYIQEPDVKMGRLQ